MWTFCHTEDDWGPSSSVRSMSPINGPILKDRSATNIGVMSCMSYLDDKGFGPSLVHRNGVTCARIRKKLQSLLKQIVLMMQHLVQHSILGATLNSPLGNMKGDYAVGQYTLADCAWAGVCQVATNMGKGNAIAHVRKSIRGLLLCNHIHLQVKKLSTHSVVWLQRLTMMETLCVK